MGKQWRRLVSRSLRPILTLATRPYVAGPGLPDGLRVCCHFSERGYATTLGYWNGNDETAAEVARAYLEALAGLERQRLDCYLSIKAPALHADQWLVRMVAEQATARSLRVHFDSLGPEWADQTLALVDDLARTGARVGCTLPGRWRRSPDDAERFAPSGAVVRVVKGQWSDPQVPDLDVRQGFLAVVSRLSGRAASVAVATHDVPLAREALLLLQRAATPVELELLLGLPMRRPLRLAQSLGVRVRVYVPYGIAWLPYAMSQAARDPRVIWWLLHDALIGAHLRLGEVLASPGHRI